MYKSLATTAVFSVMMNNQVKAGSSVEDAGPFIGETWYSGLIDIDHSDNAADDMFFWWFESRNDPKNDPVVLWLTGGPGCASEIALFYENGPYKFNEDGKTLKSNPYSWNENANLIYVDQPVGTGFSHANPLHLVTNEDEVGDNMAQFLIKFLEKYPQLQGKDFYITGESYAGHYIPAISHNLIFKNKDNLKMNFKGMAIGNGLVDPYLQYPQYDTFSKENKLIGEAEYLVLKGAFAGCQGLIETGIWPIALEFCQIFTEVILGNPVAPRFNVYDIREKCDKPPLCYDMSPADNLLAEKNIQKILGVSGRSWTECNMVVHSALLGDWMLDLSPKVTQILDSGLDVLVYSGDKDFICNWRGGEAWTHAVDWTGKDSFSKAEYGDWNVSDKPAGSLKTFNNLKFLRVYEAGHMVPMNQPEAALQMLNEFTAGKILEEDVAQFIY
jgi:cathepsin A (carboxypeptidase C)